MDFRRFARRAAKFLPIFLALTFLFLSFSHRDSDSLIKQSRAEAAERLHQFNLRSAMDRERYLASRQGAQFGVPKQALAHARAQRRALTANKLGASAAAFADPAQALQWNPLGPVPMSFQANFTGAPIGSSVAMTGRVTAVAADAHSVIVAGTASGGLWISTNDGGSFSSVFDNEPTEAIGAIALDTTTSPSTIYVGTGEGNNSVDSLYGAGLYKSTSLGQSWAQIGGADTFDRASFTSLAIDTQTTPGIPRIFAGTTSGFSSNRADAGTYETDSTFAGLWLSTDGGNSFPQHYPESTFNNCDVLGGTDAPCGADDVKIDPRNPQNVYVAIDTDSVYVSSNGGQTFQVAAISVPGLQGRHSLAIGPAVTNSTNGTVYAMIGALDGIEYLGMFVSTDGGNSWNSISNPPTVPSFTGNGVVLDGTNSSDVSQSYYDQAILVNPTDPSTLYFGGVGLYLSAGNFGHTWSFIAQNGGIHSDIHALTVNPTDGNVLVGTDGGLFAFNPSGGASPTFVSLNQNINAGLIQGIGPHPTDPTKLIAGFQSGGTQLYSGSTSEWAAPASESGDGGFALYDPLDPNFLYHTFSTDQINGELVSASANGGTTWCSQPNASIPACDVTDDEWTASLDDVMFNVSDDPGPAVYPPIASDPTTAHRVLFGAHFPYVSTDAMAHWALQSDTDLTSPGGFIGVGNCPNPPQTGSCPCADNFCSIEDIEFGPATINSSNPSDSVYPVWSLAMSNLDGSVAFEVANTTQGNLQVNPAIPIGPSNEGAFWSDATTGLDTVMRKTNTTLGVLATQATSIAPDPFNNNVAWIGLSGFTADTMVGHLYKTVNFGATWTLADGNTISGNNIVISATALPDVPVLKVLVDATDQSGSCGGSPCSNSIYVGTDVGVFHTADGGKTWLPITSGLPDVPIYDIEQNTNGTVFAGTHGRGAFQLANAATSTATATETATATTSATPTATATTGATATATAKASSSATATATTKASPSATATATGGTPSNTPTATATPDGAKMVAPKALVLPAVGIGTGATAMRSFVIRNASRTGNLIGSVAIEPSSVMPASSVFSITAGASFNIAPLKTATVTVSLSPNGTTNTANAIITSNDPAHLSQTVSIRADAFAGRASIPAAVTIVGTVGQPATATLKVTNVGRGSLSGNWQAVTTAPYSVTAGTFGPLPFRASAPPITIGFTATAKGRAATGSLIITVNPPSTGSRTVSLRGVGR